MKTKIIGFIVCFLLIGFSVISATGNMIYKKDSEENSYFENSTNKQSNCKSGLLDYWTEQEKLQSSDGNPGDFFGCSVSIDGNYAIVGAYEENDDTEQ